MASTIVELHEAKTHLSRIVDQVVAGQEVIIAKAGKPVARLVPLATEPPRKRLGALAGRLVIPADFDAPLQEEALVRDTKG